jgi:hypothetical protein
MFKGDYCTQQWLNIYISWNRFIQNILGETCENYDLKKQVLFLQQIESSLCSNIKIFRFHTGRTGAHGDWTRGRSRELVPGNGD